MRPAGPGAAWRVLLARPRAGGCMQQPLPDSTTTRLLPPLHKPHHAPTGACEFNAAGLNRTWFFPRPAKTAVPGSRLHAIYAASFKRTPGGRPRGGAGVGGGWGGRGRAAIRMLRPGCMPDRAPDGRHWRVVPAAGAHGGAASRRPATCTATQVAWPPSPPYHTHTPTHPHDHTTTPPHLPLGEPKGNHFPLAWAPNDTSVPAHDVTQHYLDAAAPPRS